MICAGPIMHFKGTTPAHLDFWLKHDRDGVTRLIRERLRERHELHDVFLPNEVALRGDEKFLLESALRQDLATTTEHV